MTVSLSALGPRLTELREQGTLAGNQSLVSRVLRVPLLGKLLGANLIVVVAELAAHVVFPSASMAVQLGGTLALSFCVTALLVWLALRPLAQLEAVADRVSHGDFSSRVPVSPIADRDIAKLSCTLNRLLDKVESDRTRIQYLAGRGVRARDIERESVARELRESFAQTLSGIALRNTALRLATVDPAVRAQTEDTGTLIQELMDDMRSVAETLYPGTLEEFGLLNALEALARRVTRRSGLRVEVQAESFRAVMSSRATSALYRVAEEALRNIEQHANAKHAWIRLQSNGLVTLDIEDDGRGIDLRSNDPLQAGLGLFSARAVLALCEGDLQISSGPKLGTRVVARVPAETLTRQT